jgi:hypothetical protein
MEFLSCFIKKSLQFFTSTFHKSTYIEAQNKKIKKMSLFFDIKNKMLTYFDTWWTQFYTPTTSDRFLTIND